MRSSRTATRSGGFVDVEFTVGAPDSAVCHLPHKRRDQLNRGIFGVGVTAHPATDLPWHLAINRDIPDAVSPVSTSKPWVRSTAATQSGAIRSFG